MPKKSRVNASKISRGLFKAKPSIAEDWSYTTIPRHMLGEEKSIPPVRSDIGGIKVSEGEEFMTYDLWVRAQRKKRLSGVKKWVGRDRPGGKEVGDVFDMTGVYLRPLIEQDWREEPDTSKKAYEKWRTDRGMPKVSMPQKKLKGLTEKEKEEYYAKTRKGGGIEGFEGLMSMSKEQERRQELIETLEKERKNMTRAQQRKLGRVIREGKTKPIRTTRDEPSKKWVNRMVYDKTYYDEVEVGIPNVEGELEYEFGHNEPNTYLKERKEREERYKPLYQQQLEIAKERKNIDVDIFNLLKEVKLTEGQLAGHWIPNTEAIELDKALRASKKQIKGAKVPTYKERKWLLKNPEYDPNLYIYLRDKIGGIKEEQEHPPYDMGGRIGNGYHPALSKAEKQQSKFLKDLEKGDRHTQWLSKTYRKKTPLIPGERHIPTSLRPLLTPEQYKFLERQFLKESKLSKQSRAINKDADKIRREKGSGPASRPKQNITSKTIAFSNQKELDKAIATMKEETKGKGLAHPIDRKGKDAEGEKSSYYVLSEDIGGSRYLTRDFNDKDRKSYYEGGERNKPMWMPKSMEHPERIRHAGSFDTLKVESPSRQRSGHRTYEGQNALYKYRKFYGLDDWGREMTKATESTIYKEGEPAVKSYGTFHKANREGKYLKKSMGVNPLDSMEDNEEITKWLKQKGHLTTKTKLPESIKSRKEVIDGKEYTIFDKEVVLGKGDIKSLRKVGDKEIVMEKGTTLRESDIGKFFKGKDGRIYKVRKKPRKERRKIRKIKKIPTGIDAMNNPQFQLRVARGKGRRTFHIEEAKEKGWREVKPNHYTKQVQAWRELDPTKVPKTELQLRGIRDNRTAGSRLIGRGRRGPRYDGKGQYKSARDEALIQMKINESVGVRDLRTRKDKEIKDIRISEAQKALNLKLAKETAEKNAEALKAKNAGLTHSYNVNVRNQSAATLLGGDPDELNKLLKKGGGLSLIKTMVRKGEITDVSTIGQLRLSTKQKDTLLRLLSEGGKYVEGQEYFFRHIDDTGQTKVQRGYLNKGGERKDNLQLMYLRSKDDGTTHQEMYLVPKENIIEVGEETYTTRSGKKQARTPRKITDFELDLFGGEGEEATPQATRQVRDSKGRVLTKYKGGALREPSESPSTPRGVLGALREEAPTHFESMGGDVNMDEELAEQLAQQREESGSSDEAFDFGGEGEEEALEEEFLTGMDANERAMIEAARTPRPQGAQIDQQLDALMGGTPPPMLMGGLGQERHAPRVQPEPEPQLEAGEAQQIADELGGGMTENLAFSVRQKVAEEIMSSPELTTEQREEELGKLRELEETKPDRADRDAEGRVPRRTKPQQKEGMVAKKVLIADELKSLTAKEPELTMPTSTYEGWDMSEMDVPEELIRENWDMRKRGLNERMDSGGTQEVPDGSVVLWSPKHNDKSNQNTIILSAADAYHLLRGMRGVGIKNDRGKSNPITSGRLKSIYHEILALTRSGKKSYPMNDKQFLRALDLYPSYESQQQEEEIESLQHQLKGIEQQKQIEELRAQLEGEEEDET